jgi:hypothetical protein
MDEPDIDEACRYVLDVLRTEGVDDPVAYIAAIDAETRNQKRNARRAYRMAYFQGRIQ